MIGKVVNREKASSSFSKLANYVLEARGDTDEILWTRTADYILDTQGDGEKVAWFDVTNCDTDVPGIAVTQVLATQARNTRTKSDKTYHVVLSFREDEQVTREQLKDIEESICQGLGFEGHQRVSACHINTENTHLHIVINKIHPTHFRCVEPYYPYLKIDALCKELEQKHGLERDNRIADIRHQEKSNQMETHTGEQSLLTWVKTTALSHIKVTVQEGQSWEALHETLSKFGLAIKLRGAGLVIATQDETLSIKASSVERSLSFKALTDRFGAYEPPKQQSQQTDKPLAYQRQPRQQFGNSSVLYADYQKQQQMVWQARREMKERQTLERQTFNEVLKAWHNDERANIRQGSFPLGGKQKAYQQIAAERQKRLKTHQEKQKTEREQVFNEYPVMTWQSYLVKSAEQGNSQALEVLRYRKRRQEYVAKALFTAADLTTARNIVLKQHKPYVRKNGDLMYRVSDGGVVTDEKHHVRVDEVTTGATFLALTLATERFKGQALEVKGEDNFKHQVVQLAVHYNLDVQFSDQRMEIDRQQQTQLKAQADTAMSVTLDAYISIRNEMRKKSPDQPFHRLWRSEDIGNFIYQGERQLSDGNHIVLLSRNDEVLIKTHKISADNEFSKLPPGQSININETGQMQLAQNTEQQR